MKYFLKHKTSILILLFCLLVGFFLRSYNLNWDQGLLFHPDERNIANAVTKIIFFTQLNPQFFAYGGFSIYLYRAIADSMVFLTHNSAWVMDWGKIDFIGRSTSSVFSTLTLIPLYLLARKLFGRQVALLSCLFYTFTVTSIQHAHFATTESSLIFFVTLLCFFAILWVEKIRFWKTVLFGMLFGIALATKISALSMGALPAMSMLMYVLQERKSPKKLISLIPHIFIFVIITGIFFTLLSPYTFLDSKDFLASMQYESGVATGSLPVVYTYQFNGSIPYLFQIQNFIWQFGPLLAGFGIIGLLFLIVEPLRKTQKNRILFWIFPLIYFLYVGSWHTKFLRYMTPLVPFIVIAASYILLLFQQKYKKIGTIIILLALLTTIIWAGAFFSIYTRPQTRIAASLWMYQHIQPGAIILTEAWDDGLPVPVSGLSPSLYQEKQLDMYMQDGPQKIIYLATQLSQADYIAINSRRIYGTLIRLTNQYPITSKYYKFLFAGKLGYERVATFSSYPQIFGITINDDGSEETFQVYEHPKAIIFKNTNHYSAQHIADILGK